MTKHDQQVHLDKAARALRLTELGIDTQAICERLGISRHRLEQIKARAKKPRKAAPAARKERQRLK